LLTHTHLILPSWLLLHVLLLLWIHWSSCWNWLRHTWRHSFKLLLVALYLVRIMLLIHVLILFLITSSLIVTTTSATVISLSSSSVLVLLSSVTVIQVLIDLSLILILYPHLIIGHDISVILSYKINLLQYLLLRIIVILLFDIVFRSPEVYFYWSAEPEFVRFMEFLNTFLSLFYVFV